MLFNSLQFAFFFPVVVLAYFSLPHRFRWAMLLVASYGFYMGWKPAYALLLLVATVIPYFAALGMGGTSDLTRRKLYLGLSIAANLGILGTFKYFNFLNGSLREALGFLQFPWVVPDLDFLLPVGISFYTFQSMSYAIDVYRGDREPERHFGIFALYVSFFPQLVAGPIERSTNLLPQFRQAHRFDYARAADGLRLMAWGLFKKVVIADRLAVVVDQVYNSPQDHGGGALILATYLFAFQIYCDFSGYSDIAIGASRVMGYDLMENFRRPYFAKSVGEFWRRWHISLSTWFRDYVYVPLGGNRRSRWVWYRNIAAVFLISGLWHGAAWTYVIWGALHASYMLIEIRTQGARERLSRWLQLNRFPGLHKLMGILFTFHLVLFAWIFFRANSLADAWYIVTHLFQGPALDLAAIQGLKLGLGIQELLLAFLCLGLLELVHLIERRQPIYTYLAGKPLLLRWSAYMLLVLAIIHLRPVRPAAFLYFQF